MKITREDQERVINELLENHRKYLMCQLPKVPEHWDGIELRNWYVESATVQFYHDMGPTRTKDFENDIAVHNL